MRFLLPIALMSVAVFPGCGWLFGGFDSVPEPCVQTREPCACYVPYDNRGLWGCRMEGASQVWSCDCRDAGPPPDAGSWITYPDVQRPLDVGFDVVDAPRARDTGVDRPSRPDAPEAGATDASSDDGSGPADDALEARDTSDLGSDADDASD